MKHLMVKSVATLVIVLGSFLFLNDVNYADTPGNTCYAGNGAKCVCEGTCGANATQCWCN